MKVKNLIKRILSFMPFFASIAVFVSAGLIYMYANGWRLDLPNRAVVKTGVLTVDSEPFWSTLFVEGKDKGRTPKSMSLPVGTYRIKVAKEGYLDWYKEVDIKEEKSTPLSAWLIREDITEENIFLLDTEEYIGSWVNDNHDHIFFLTNSLDPQTELYTYKIWRYDINTTFWDLTSNPKSVFSMNSETPLAVDVLPSPNGEFVILSVIDSEETNWYYLNTNQVSTFANTQSLPINTFSESMMSWSKDSRYLMFESEKELISFSPERETKYLLLKKTLEREYIWTTDEQGYFYSVENNADFKENTSVYAYILNQTEMDGSNPKILVNDLFFQKNVEYIEAYKDDSSDGKYALFTNSPESTKSVGELQDIVINQNAQGIYISTTQASYWYNMEDKKYILISPYPSSFVQFGYDNLKLLFKENGSYGVFTFDKEEGNHTVSIGAKTIEGLNDTALNVRWLSNSKYVSFIENNTLYLSDKDGDNKTLILENVDSSLFTCINNSKDNVFTFTVENSLTPEKFKTVSISRYTIH